MIIARLIILSCFLAAFAAGVCVGMLWQQRARAAQQEGRPGELNLSPEQREKIKAIWDDPQRVTARQARRERREAAQKERDEALRALITGEQKPRYEELVSGCQKKLEEISQESRKANDETNERIKALLTESQRATFDELRKKREEARSRARGDSTKKAAAESATEKSAAPSATEAQKGGGAQPGQ